MMKRGEFFPVIEKYLAMVEYEAADTVPKLAGKLVKAIQESNDKSFDLERIKASMKKYNMSVKQHIDNLEVSDALGIVRNNVSAHHLTRELTLDGVLSWHVASRKLFSQGMTFLDSKFTALAVGLCQDLEMLAEGLDNR